MFGRVYDHQVLGPLGLPSKDSYSKAFGPKDSCIYIYIYIYIAFELRSLMLRVKVWSGVLEGRWGAFVSISRKPQGPLFQFLKLLQYIPALRPRGGPGDLIIGLGFRVLG